MCMRHAWVNQFPVGAWMGDVWMQCEIEITVIAVLKINLVNQNADQNRNQETWTIFFHEILLDVKPNIL